MLNKTKIRVQMWPNKNSIIFFRDLAIFSGGKKTEYSEYRRAWMQQQQADSEIAKTLRRRWCLEEKLRSKPPTSFFINPSAFFLSSWASSSILQFLISINLLEEWRITSSYKEFVKIWSSSMHARGGGGGDGTAAVDCISFISVFFVMNYFSLIFAKRSMQAASVLCCF